MPVDSEPAKRDVVEALTVAKNKFVSFLFTLILAWAWLEKRHCRFAEKVVLGVLSRGLRNKMYSPISHAHVYLG